MKDLAADDVWIAKKIYDDAETAHYENQSRVPLTPLAEEVAKARQKLIESRDIFASDGPSVDSFDAGALGFIQKKLVHFEKVVHGALTKLDNIDIADVLSKLNTIEARVSALEKLATGSKPVVHEINVAQQPPTQEKDTKDDNDDVDLFASDSEEESEEAAKIRNERLAAYAAKKSKKPVLIAKSNIILDIKPWDDETDMKAMEEKVRQIVSDGLLWGQAKLVPLAYGIKKLQISSVVEDEKVSVDWMTEQIEAIEDLVQSVDIAAFNKI